MLVDLEPAPARPAVAPPRKRLRLAVFPRRGADVLLTNRVHDHEAREAFARPLDREDYLSWAFQSLRLERMAELVEEYDPELVKLIQSDAAVKNKRAPKPDAEENDESDHDHDQDDGRPTWFDRQAYLEYAFRRLTRPEIVRLLKHCERDVLRYIRSQAVAVQG